MKEHLRKYFPLYLFWIIISLVITSWEFSLLTKTKEEEKVDLFICATLKDEESFSNLLSTNKPEYLKELNYSITSKDDSMYGTLLQTKGKVEADIYIMPKSKLDSMDYDYYFTSLDTNKVELEYGSNLTYYYGNEKVYGIKINLDYFEDDQDELYLLFATGSLHLGSFIDSSLDGAINVAKLFIK